MKINSENAVKIIEAYLEEIAIKKMTPTEFAEDIENSIGWEEVVSN